MYNAKEYKKKYYIENKEAQLKRCREKYLLNREKILKRRKENLKKETPEQREKRLNFHKEYNKRTRPVYKQKAQNDEPKFKQYIFSAKRRNYSFDLSFEVFKKLFHSNCTYCSRVECRGIDRVVNTLGYTETNSVPCCDMCNKMKWRLSEDEFKQQVQKIYQNLFNS